LVQKTEVFFKQQNEEARNIVNFIKRNPSGSKYKALRRPISRIMNKPDERLKTTREKELKEKRETKEKKEQLNLTLKTNPSPK